MGIEWGEDINALFEEHSRELIADDYLFIQDKQHLDMVEKIGSPANEILAKEILNKF